MHDGATGDRVLDAELLELDYAHSRPDGQLGRNGKYVITRTSMADLPRICVVTGDGFEEAEADNVKLLRVTKKLTWVPPYVNALAVLGLLCFGPLLLVAIVLYFVQRKKVVATYSIRSDARRRKHVRVWALVLLAVAALAGGISTTIQLGDDGLAAGLGVIGCVIFAIIAAVVGKSVSVRKIEGEWATFAGFSPAFMSEVAFDFERPTESYWSTFRWA